MEPNVTVEEITQKPSLLGMITFPSEQFERMKGKVKLAVPMTILILLQAVFIGIVAYLGTKDPAFIKAQASLPSEFKLAPAIVIGIGIVMGVIGVLITYFLGAAIYKIVAMLTGSDITYPKILAILVYTSVIGLVGTILNVTVMAAFGGTEPMYTNLSSLFEKKSVLSALAKSFDVIAIWQYVITVLGLQIAGSVAKKKAITIVVTVFVIFTLAYVGFTALTSLATHR